MTLKLLASFVGLDLLEQLTCPPDVIRFGESLRGEQQYPRVGFCRHLRMVLTDVRLKPTRLINSGTGTLRQFCSFPDTFCNRCLPPDMSLNGRLFGVSYFEPVPGRLSNSTYYGLMTLRSVKTSGDSAGQVANRPPASRAECTKEES